MDELWRTTCFEAFIARPGGGYYEFNLSPSTAWAAYSFEGYRAGMKAADRVPPPVIRGRLGAAGYGLEAELVLDGLPDLPGEGPWRVGLTCILEDGEGGRSYWALAHAPNKPDFHHPDSFALDLPVTETR